MISFDRPEVDVWGRRRARIVAGMLALIFTVIVGRSAYVAMNGPELVAASARSVAVASVRRADIVDRKGELLATTVPGWSLAANPNAIWDAGEVATALKKVLPRLDLIGLTAQLSDRKRKFIWVQRGLTQEEKDAAFGLGVEGLQFVEEARRVYPRGKLAGHFLGYTNIDGEGLEGSELAFDKRLKEGGEPLRLTLDASVQFVVEEELERAFVDFDMKGGVGVVVDANTGAVRAVASWPALDPNRRGAEDASVKLNRALNARFELGSIFKPLTVAEALDAGTLTPTDRFDVSTPVKIGGATVRDLHPLPNAKSVTAGDVLAYSSNIGTALIAQRAGVERQKAFLRSVHLLGGQSHEGPQTASPLTPEKWDQTAMATVSYGHGISVSPLAFAMTYTPFGNGGNYVPPVFVEPIDLAKVEKSRVMKPETAATVLGMLRETVTRGTGKNAEAQGYEVAGKTGTAEKPGPDGYDPNKNITSFAAVFPTSRPQFVVLVVLDEAQPRTGDQRTASTTAAMIAGKVIARAAPLLDVQPVLVASKAEAASLRGSEATTP
jgi:cell division protein FtsI (penicillin-binding protein 3)